jgi:regulatory protein
MIEWELRQKGVSDQEIEAALEGVDDEASALQAAQKRWPRLQALPVRERKKKLSDFLARNGFDYSVIEETLRRIESLHH